MKTLRGFVLILITLLTCGPLAAFARQDKTVDKAAAKSREEEMKKAANPPAAPPQTEEKKEEPKKPEPFSSPTFAGLRFRLIGPAFTSGRVVAVAVDPTDHSRYFVGAASGGVWKTTNAGTTWTPVFDNEASYSIGVVVIDPKNPLTV